MGAGGRRGRRGASGGRGPGVADEPTICRVLPDVPALDRAFDYAVPESLVDVAVPGTAVRIVLRGRRVRGWVVEVGVEPETSGERLLPLAKVSSAGPPGDLLDLTQWAARRWAGPRCAFLRQATPPNNVPAGRGIEPASGHGGRAFEPAEDPGVEAVAAQSRQEAVGIVEWPPATRMAELLRRLVSAEGSTLFIVPDAVRARALLSHLDRRGVSVVAMLGDAPHAERTAAWDRARAGTVAVVGGRAAAWAPVPDLAAVVVVDDGDEALKDERAPAWHARDVGVERARRAGGRLTVVSPAPSLEAQALGGASIGLRPAERREGWGRVISVDRRDEPPGAGLYSDELVQALRRVAEAGGRAVCVLNRKGRARLLACGSCRELVRCEGCGAAATETEGGLACPVCGATRPRVCASCGSTTLARLRPGIARVREELEALVPGADVAEVDASSEGEVDAPLLIGTEAVLHRATSADVVAFLDFDQELLAPRYRASEQALWLIVRAARLVGPRSGGGRVLIQTRLPDHPVVRAGRDADPAIWAQADDDRRRALRLPPHVALAAADGSAAALAEVERGLDGRRGVDALGPVPLGGERFRLLIRAEGHGELAEALAGAVPAGRTKGGLRVEVDPLRV